MKNRTILKDEVITDGRIDIFSEIKVTIYDDALHLSQLFDEDSGARGGIECIYLSKKQIQELVNIINQENLK